GALHPGHQLVPRGRHPVHERSEQAVASVFAPCVPPVFSVLLTKEPPMTNGGGTVVLADAILTPTLEPRRYSVLKFNRGRDIPIPDLSLTSEPDLRRARARVADAQADEAKRRGLGCGELEIAVA